MDVKQITVRLVRSSEEREYQTLMEKHHYLGALPKISETLWYVACWEKQWVALLSYSASALKCAARDNWIGWNMRYKYDRLKLIVNNSRFLILPDWHRPNLGSRVLSLCSKRLNADWEEAFGHGIVLLETFVDATRFSGTVYKSANWIYVGDTKGYRRIRHGYSATAQTPKKVFVMPFRPDAQAVLCRPELPSLYQTETSKMMLDARHMESLPSFFSGITDPRRKQGRRHRLSTILGIATAACLCGMRGYRAMADWAKSLSPAARRRFGCRYEEGSYSVPSEYIIRDILIRIDPVELDRALQSWNTRYAKQDKSLAIDGKVMRNALDDQGYQTHIVSVIGHQTKHCYTQKKSEHCLQIMKPSNERMRSN